MKLAKRNLDWVGFSFPSHEFGVGFREFAMRFFYITQLCPGEVITPDYRDGFFIKNCGLMFSVFKKTAILNCFGSNFFDGSEVSKLSRVLEVGLEIDPRLRLNRLDGANDFLSDNTTQDLQEIWNGSTAEVCSQTFCGPNKELEYFRFGASQFELCGYNRHRKMKKDGLVPVGPSLRIESRVKSWQRMPDQWQEMLLSKAGHEELLQFCNSYLLKMNSRGNYRVKLYKEVSDLILAESI